MVARQSRSWRPVRRSGLAANARIPGGIEKADQGVCKGLQYSLDGLVNMTLA